MEEKAGKEEPRAVRRQNARAAGNAKVRTPLLGAF